MNFFNRIWPIQLCVDPNIWCNIGIGHNGFMWNRFRAPSVAMWFKSNTESKRNTWCCIISWHHMFITFMGFLSWYKRSTLRHSTNANDSIFAIISVITNEQFLHIRFASISQWIFVSETSLQWFHLSKMQFSLFILTVYLVRRQRFTHIWVNSMITIIVAKQLWHRH